MECGAEYLFGPFRLSPRRHELLRDGAPVALGSRAVALLAALVEADGARVTKHALIERVRWPGRNRWWRPRCSTWSPGWSTNR